jgi:PIN domain nuclease of toxin-antitoxin system
MRLLLDTHVLVWLLNDSDRIGSAIYNKIERAAEQDLLFVSAITPWEIAMLVAKGRLGLNRDVADWIDAALNLPGIHLEPLSRAIAVASTRLPPARQSGQVHPDPADRILIATARNIDATLVTADERMLDYAKAGHLRCLAPA